MTALLVLNYDVIDKQRLQDYRLNAGEAILGSTGRLVTSTDHTIGLDEGTSTGSRTVIVQYPSRADAEARYSSAAYQSLLPERLAATIPRTALIVELTGSEFGSYR